MPRSKDITTLETIGVFLQGIACTLTAGRQEGISALAASAHLRLEQISPENRPEQLVMALSEISRISSDTGTPAGETSLALLQELCADAIAAASVFTADHETA